MITAKPVPVPVYVIDLDNADVRLGWRQAWKYWGRNRDTWVFKQLV